MTDITTKKSFRIDLNPKPDELVSGVIDALQKMGFTGMKSVETIKENMHFVLPAELRRKK